MSTTTHVRQAVTGGGRTGWKDALGRFGLVGRGILYLTVGLLAVQLARGQAADADQEGAIEWIAAQSFGKFLLVVLTAALFALTVWRFLDAVFGDPVEGSDTSDRLRFAGKGVIYLVLAVGALTTTVANWSGGSAGSGGGGSGGGAGGSSGQQQQKATAAVLDWPAGRWIVGLAGIAVIAYAVRTVKRHVVDRRFLERMDVGERSWLAEAGRAGYAGRAAVWALIGWFLLQAGITHRPGESKGLSGALQEVSAQSWGQWLLWFVALGLVAFGLFNFGEAKHRRAA